LLVAFLCAFITSQAVPVFASIDHSGLFSEGEKAFTASNFSAAAENFAAALKYAPENLRARFRYGQALFSLKRFAESHSQFQAILQNSPNNIIARVYLAENLVELNRNDDARSHLEWILKVQPGHVRANEILNSLKAGVSTVTKQMPEQIPLDQKPLPVKNSDKTFADTGKEFKLSPYVANSGEKTDNRARKINRPAREKLAVAVKIPPTAVAAADFSLESFLAKAHSSFLMNLELAKFYIESGDLAAAATSLNKAMQLESSNSNSRRFLEMQILTSMVHIYNRDFNSFGKQLVNLKPILGSESYKSFLDIYNQGSSLGNNSDQARLAAGIAMGANHHAVAARLLLEVFVENPDDQLVAHLLADAQLQSLDYKGAENTLVHLARNNPNNAEAHFNLARFYLTVFYQPELARRYAVHASSLKPGDARTDILLGLADYSEGKVKEGSARIQQLLPQITDPAMINICQQILCDSKQVDAGGRPVDFASNLALPGAPHANLSSYRLPGEDFLRQGSFLTAMKYFAAARDSAEIGRTYLGIASALNAGGESELSALAAGYGLGAMNADLQQNPGNGRAHLYTALYWFERNNQVAARQAINRGLTGKSDQATRQRLTAMMNNLDS